MSIISPMASGQSYKPSVKFGRMPVETAAQAIEEHLGKLPEAIHSNAKTDVLVKTEAKEAPKPEVAGAKPKSMVWVTSEREPVRAGGLGVVSQSIPWALAKNLGYDIRVVVPYLKPMQDEDAQLRRTGKAAKAFKSTGLTITLHVPDHGPNSKEKFEVLQRFEAIPEDVNKPANQQRGNMVYAIKNNKYFGGDDLYTYTAAATKPLGSGKKQPLLDLDPSFVKNMIFTRLVSQLLPYLEPGAAPRNTTLSTFKQKVDVLLANDWMSGPLFRELSALKSKFPDYNPRKIQYVHNQNDTSRPLSHAKALGMTLPTEPSLIRAANPIDDPATLARTEGQYSPLALGAHDSDALIINRPYAKALAETPLIDGHIVQDALRQKILAGKFYDVHHAPSPRFNPKTSADLKVDGFRQWDEKADPTMAAFKKHNRVALQNLLGMKKDPDATIVTWIARIESRQKGFNLLRDNIVDALKENPKLQFVIWGKSNDADKAAITALNEKVANDPALRGRLHMPNTFISGKESKKLTQSLAGSDFTPLFSNWEPMGLSQTEAKAMGVIPIANPVDGIRPTVSDPSMNGKSWVPSLNKKPEEAGKDYETVWKYGQTGILMEPVPVANYLRSLDRANEIEATEKLLKKATEASSREAGLTMGSTEQIGRRAKEALNDESIALKADGKALNDGYTRPTFTPEQRKELEGIVARQFPPPKPGIEQKALEASKRRFLTPEEQKSLSSDVNLFKNIFSKADQGVLTKAQEQAMIALKRGIELAGQPEKMAEVRKNAMKFVNTEHSQDAIVKRFYEPIFADTAVAAH